MGTRGPDEHSPGPSVGPSRWRKRFSQTAEPTLRISQVFVKSASTGIREPSGTVTSATNLESSPGTDGWVPEETLRFGSSDDLPNPLVSRKVSRPATRTASRAATTAVPALHRRQTPCEPAASLRASSPAIAGARGAVPRGEGRAIGRDRSSPAIASARRRWRRTGFSGGEKASS